MQKPAVDKVHQQLYSLGSTANITSIIYHYHYGSVESSNSWSTAILRSIDSVNNTGIDFGITPVFSILKENFSSTGYNAHKNFM